MKLATLVLAVLICAPLAHADSDDLEMTVLQLAKSQEKSATQVGEFFKGNTKKMDYQVLLESGQCYWFAGASEGVKKFYMTLSPPGANLFTPSAASVKTNGSGTIAHCATESGMYKFQVKTDSDKGSYVVGVFSKLAPKQKPEEDIGLLCDKTASAASAKAKRQGEFFEGKGNSIGHDDRVDYSIQMDKGQCYWVVGCGDPKKVSKLALYLWGPDNKRITETKSDTSTPMLGHCATETGMFKVQSKITSGNGKYKVAIYSKPK
jgi:hypothetical protein